MRYYTEGKFGGDGFWLYLNMSEGNSLNRRLHKSPTSQVLNSSIEVSELDTAGRRTSRASPSRKASLPWARRGVHRRHRTPICRQESTRNEARGGYCPGAASLQISSFLTTFSKCPGARRILPKEAFSQPERLPEVCNWRKVLRTSRASLARLERGPRRPNRSPVCRARGGLGRWHRLAGAMWRRGECDALARQVCQPRLGWSAGQPAS